MTHVDFHGVGGDWLAPPTEFLEGLLKKLLAVRDSIWQTTAVDYHKYLTERLGRAVSRRSDAEQIIAGAKHVLTMSTCNYYEGYGRSELIAIPKNEANGTAATQQQGTPAEAAAAAADVVADASSQEAQ
jgi:hypothetical protein